MKKSIIAMWEAGISFGLTNDEKTKIINDDLNPKFDIYKVENVVINDAYSEFRMALMRGGEILISPLFESSNVWRNFQLNHLEIPALYEFVGSPDDYKIKIPAFNVDSICYFWNESEFPKLGSLVSFENGKFLSSDGNTYSKCKLFLGEVFWK